MKCCGSESTRHLFAEHGLRCTRQRAEVYEALSACRSHPTAEELHATLDGDGASMSLATIYNSLEALCQAGLCRKLASTGGAARYDADLSAHAHIATPDGRLLDVPPELSASLTELVSQDVLDRIAEEMQVRISHVAIKIHGVVENTR